MADDSPETVTAALGPYLSEERRARIEEVIACRLAGLTVVFENLHDPHNGAAAIRSVEAMGMCSLHAVEVAEPFRFSPKVTQGCEKWVDIARYRDFRSCAQRLHDGGFVLGAAIPGATLPLHDIDVRQRVALVFGNEHSGLTDLAASSCDFAFGIPMLGFTRSFNLSVSVALAVHECAQRRRLVLGLSGDLTAAEQSELRARFYALSMDERAAQGIVIRHQKKAKL
ncbi:MAG: RNA methyltransferase [Pseudomonadota bacterium]